MHPPCCITNKFGREIPWYTISNRLFTRPNNLLNHVYNSFRRTYPSAIP